MPNQLFVDLALTLLERVKAATPVYSQQLVLLDDFCDRLISDKAHFRLPDHKKLTEKLVFEATELIKTIIQEADFSKQEPEMLEQFRHELACNCLNDVRLEVKIAKAKRFCELIFELKKEVDSSQLYDVYLVWREGEPIASALSRVQEKKDKPDRSHDQSIASS